MTEPTELLPCPFCGHSGPLNFQDGSTHRWGVAYCAECGASAGETRREYPDVGEWHAKAIVQWNTRTPQPAQAQAGAVPLTDNELVRRSRVGAIQTDENGKVVMWPAYYRTQMEDRFKRGWREAEQHHGIKGGQHGTDT